MLIFLDIKTHILILSPVASLDERYVIEMSWKIAHFSYIFYKYYLFKYKEIGSL